MSTVSTAIDPSKQPVGFTEVCFRSSAVVNRRSERLGLSEAFYLLSSTAGLSLTSFDTELRTRLNC